MKSQPKPAKKGRGHKWAQPAKKPHTPRAKENAVLALAVAGKSQRQIAEQVGINRDAGNRLTQAVDSIAGTITRGFDGLDRLTSEATPQGSVSYTFDSAGRRQTMTVAGQSTVIYAFDGANKLTQVGQDSTSVQFGYDAAGRRVTLTLANGVVTSYSYDAASQLTAMTYSLASTSLGNLGYAYDQDGHRISVTGSFARTAVPNSVNAAYNINNQLTSWGNTPISYDPNGNMTSDGAHSYAWDGRNHLKQIDSGTTASFAYDPFGRRVSKNILGVSTSFLYDGVNPVQELAGMTVTANLLTASTDEFLMRTDLYGAHHFLTDAQGSTIGLMDASGTIQTTFTYEPFGNTTVSGAPISNSYAYTGRELDATSLYFYRARYYNSVTSRFVSEDPLGFTAGPNFYAYVGNDPMDRVDPLGLNPLNCIPCLWYMNKCVDDALKCREELDKKYPDPLELCEKTHSKDLDEAYYKECFDGVPTCQKMVKYCGSCGLTPPLYPRKPNP